MNCPEKLLIPLCAGLCLGLFVTGLSAAEPDSIDALLISARRNYQQGQRDKAMSEVDKAIKLAPTEAKGYELRASFNGAAGDHTKALADLSKAIQLQPKNTRLYQSRGEENFRVGHFKESVADFDKVIELDPRQAPQHWQRGIALYYAGRYADGRRQFESHQTVNPNDVENAVWHFLCTTRETDLKTAKEKLIPIKGDSRVPMTEIHALFAGKAEPADVLKAAKSGNPKAAARQYQLFYAHLYLGIYYEATGNDAKASEHIIASATKHGVRGYMGDVARVHAMVLRAGKN